MYEPLRFSSFDATIINSFLTHRSEHLMMLANTSPYIYGYHGYQHMLYTLNTFSLLTGRRTYEKSEDGNLTFYPLKEDSLEIPSLDKKQNNMIVALIWHDCNYHHPEDDYTNTEEAIEALAEAYSEQEEAEDKDDKGLNLDTVTTYIRGLQYPYKPDEDSSTVSEEIKLLRDCDMSMILYDDYLDSNGLFLKLIRHEFKDLTAKELNRRATAYIENLQYYTPYLNKVLERISKEDLLARVRNTIIEHRS